MSETIRNKRKLLGALEEAIQYINSAIDGVNSNDKDCMEEYVAGAVGVLKGFCYKMLLSISCMLSQQMCPCIEIYFNSLGIVTANSPAESNVGSNFDTVESTDGCRTCDLNRMFVMEALAKLKCKCYY